MPNSSSAAQLIENLPFSLEKNWQRCVQVDTINFDCKTINLNNRFFTNKFTDTVIRYRKAVIFHSKLKNQPIAIYIEALEDADEVYFNDHLIGRSGKLPPTFENAYLYPRMYFIPQHIIKYDQFNQIEIRAFSSRGVEPLQFSTPVILPFERAALEIHNNDFIFIIIVSITALLSILQFYNYFMNRGQFEVFYLIAFLIATALFSISRSQIPAYSGFDLNDNLRLSTFLLSICISSLVLFCMQFSGFITRRWNYYLFLLPASSALIALFWIDSTNLLNVYVFSQWLWVVVLLIFLVDAYTRSRRKKNILNQQLVLGQIIFWGLLTIDGFLQSRFFRSSIYLFDVALLPLALAINGVYCSLLNSKKMWSQFKGSTFDFITGTLTRSAFLQRLNEEMLRAKRDNNCLMIAMIDIEQVRRLSVNYGQSIHTQLLNSVSHTLTKTLRPFDLICRMNDDEFCVAAVLHDEKDASTCLKRLSESLDNLKLEVSDDLELVISAKIGGVIYKSEHHLSVQQLIHDANHALSKAKFELTNGYYLLDSSNYSNDTYSYY